jgi:undecaprenyl-diphosphatase
MIAERLVTDLGDLLGVSVVAAVLTIWCWRQLDRLTAAVFILTYAADVVVTTGLKTIAAGMNPPPPELDPLGLSSGAPSGHVALTVVVYGSAALLFAHATRGWAAATGVIACVCVIAGVAVTRVTTGAHTIGDVLAGAAVGGAILALPVTVLRTRPPQRAGSGHWLLAAMTLAAAVMLSSGLRMPSGDFKMV